MHHRDYIQRWRWVQAVWRTHPIGEVNEPAKTVLAQVGKGAMVVDAMGGRVNVRWDETAQATPHGQIVFFAEFRATAGVFDRWVQSCPLHYSSPNASRSRDVLRTLMLCIPVQAGQRLTRLASVCSGLRPCGQLEARVARNADDQSLDGVRRGAVGLAHLGREGFIEESV